MKTTFENYEDKIVFSRISGKEMLKYSIGALLYTPAINDFIAKDISNKRYAYLKSLALCLEDSIVDNSVQKAEKQLLKTIESIYEAISSNKISIDDVPLIFIRVRSPLQMEKLFFKIKEYYSIITGFILPKFDLLNAETYKDIILKINSEIEEKDIYIMPILESESIINADTRINTLVKLKQITDSIYDYILNMRVGGNDFCNKFGLRRNCNQTIYDIGVVRNTLIDILNVFGRDYIVSGPVWEYFENGKNDNWLTGLKNELELDRINGFVGKTAIHPSQILPIIDSLKVDYSDFKDARKILNWGNSMLGVEKSAEGDRMNESKVHQNWAKRIIALSEVYGINYN